MKRIVVENLRSAYNVGNILRTADALWRGVIFVGYTARPNHKQVKKTALGAESAVPVREFEDLAEAYRFCREYGILIVAELTPTSIPLTELPRTLSNLKKQDSDLHRRPDIYVVVGNEVTGVEQSTCATANVITHIPMLGIKESLNVWQAAAMVMRELSYHFDLQ